MSDDKGHTDMVLDVKGCWGASTGGVDLVITASDDHTARVFALPTQSLLQGL